MLRLPCLILLMVGISNSLRAQFTVSGTVFDISGINYVENVRVVATNGMFSVTDSMGRYHVLVSDKDSLTFYYLDKPTQKFAVQTIQDPRRFDISLRMPIKGKYSVLKEVTVFSRSYREDSIENRQSYADIFNFQKPTLSSSMSPDGVAGADLNELINIFRFKRNKRLKAFQQRLELEEQEKYVNYRFSKLFVKRVTGLQSPLLDTFLVWYRPDYEFTRQADELVFNQYILNAYYQFQIIIPLSPALKPDN